MFNIQNLNLQIIDISALLQEPPVLHLRLKKPKNDKKVQWTMETVDNEDMNKKKSKCCCIYVKPRQFGESSSESEDECEHCFGHVELKRKNKENGGGPGPSSENGSGPNNEGIDPTPDQ